MVLILRRGTRNRWTHLSENFQNTRIPVIDVAKGLGIVLVVIGHTKLPTIAMNIIYAFHVPLFFVLSGMVFSDGKSFANIMYSKIRTLLVPYYFFGIFVTLALYMHNNISTTYQIYEFIVFGTGYNSALWFIAHLFVLTLYAQFIVKFSNKTTLYILLMLHLIIGLKFFELEISSMWRLDLLPLSFSFFIAGYLFKEQIINKITSIKWGGVIVVFVIFLTSIYFNLTHHSFADSSYGQFLDLPLNYLVASVSGILLTLFVSSKLVKFRFFHFIGQHTIVILSTHQFVPMLLTTFYISINIDMPSILHRILSVVLIYCLIIYTDKYARFIIGRVRS